MVVVDHSPPLCCAFYLVAQWFSLLPFLFWNDGWRENLDDEFIISSVFHVGMVKASQTLYNLVFPSNEECFEWVSREPLGVVSAFTIDSMEDCFIEVDISKGG